MGTISLTLPSDGSTAEVSDYNTPINAIKDEMNGNLDNDNIKANAGIAGSKLADSAVTTAKIADANVTAAKLATNAITLGYVEITADYIHNTNNNVSTQIPGLSLTFTVPSGGRKIEVTAFTSALQAVSGVTVLELWDGAVGGTKVGQANSQSSNSATTLSRVLTLSAGSKTYNLSVLSTTNVPQTVGATTNAPAFILVKAI